MEKLQIILDLVVVICGIIPTVIAVVLLIKNIIEQKNWNAIEPIIRAAMTAAEEYAKEHPEMTGEDKLNMALAAIKSGLTAAGIAFDEDLINKIIAYIDQLCSWSKTVNVKG